MLRKQQTCRQHDQQQSVCTAKHRHMFANTRAKQPRTAAYLAWPYVIQPHDEALCVLPNIKQPGVALTQQADAARTAVTSQCAINSTTHQRQCKT
jgi:hypothetical protein